MAKTGWINIERLGTRRSGKEGCVGPTGMGTKCEDLASYVDLHQRASIMEEVLNSQQARGTQPGHQSLPPQFWHNRLIMKKP